MGPDFHWGDTQYGFEVSGIHKIQWNTNFSDSWESCCFVKSRDSIQNSLWGSNLDSCME